MNKTQNYQLNQWEAEDKVQRIDFNADNARIDAAIKAVDARVDGLSGSKADQTALDALSQTVAGHTSALTHKGNCQIYTTTYQGNGKYNSGSPVTITFPQKPSLVSIAGGNWTLTVLYGGPMISTSGSNSYVLGGGWSENTLSFYGSLSAESMMNANGHTYIVTAFLALP